MTILKRAIFLLLLSCTLHSTSNAQANYQWKEGNSGGYTYKYVTDDPMQARFYTLKNGLTVVLSVNKKEPRIQTLIGVRAGSDNDPADHTALPTTWSICCSRAQINSARWTGARKRLT